MTNKKMILFAVLIMVGLGIIYLLFSRGRNKIFMMLKDLRLSIRLRVEN